MATRMAPSKTTAKAARKCRNCDQRVFDVMGVWTTVNGHVVCDDIGPHAPGDAESVIQPRPASRQRALAYLDRAKGLFEEDVIGECPNHGAYDCECAARNAYRADLDDMCKLHAAVEAGDRERVLSLLGMNEPKAEAA